jgi:hypothetical protein
MANPYDTGVHNLCRFGGETENIKQYWIELQITDNRLDQVAAEVYHYYNGRTSLDTAPSQKMDVGDFIKCMMISLASYTSNCSIECDTTACGEYFQ